MTFPFLIIAALTLAAALAAMTLRNLVHCALALVVAFLGLAAAYLQLDAQFVGLAQILVYVGAVAILIVFAVMLTRGGGTAERDVFSASWLWGGGVALAVFSTLAWAVRNSYATGPAPAPQVEATVKQIGEALMTKYVLPLQVIGLLLTAALIGAVIIAMRDESSGTRMEDAESQMDKPSVPSATFHPPSSGGVA